MPVPTEGKMSWYLTVRDEASGKFIKVDKVIRDTMKRSGLEVSRTGKLMSTSMAKAATGYSNASRKMRLSTMGLQHQIGRLRNILLLYFFAMRPLMRQFKAITEAATKQEFAERKLEAAFLGSGLATKKQVQNLKSLAAALQKTTMFGDEQIINAQAQLATFKLNADQVAQLTPRLLDMATAVTTLSGKEADLQAIAIALGKGFTGNVGILARYGVVIDEATKKSGDFNKMLKALDENYRGMAEAMRTTYLGQTRMTGNAYSDLKEQMGFVITQSKPLIAAFELIRTRMEENTLKIEEARKATEDYMTISLGLIATLIALAGVIKATFRELLMGIKVILQAGDAVLWFSQITTGGFKKASVIFERMQKRFEEMDRLARLIGRDFKKDVLEVFDSLVEKMKELGEINTEIIDKLKKDLDGLEDHTDKVYNAMTDFAERGAKAIHKAFSDFFFDALTGELKELKDYFRDFLRVVLRILVEIAVKQAMIKAGVSAALMHTGGVVSSAMRKPRRFHPGGLAGDEVPAVLQRGEGVLSRRGMGALAALNRGEAPGEMGGDTYVIINAVDTESFRERLVRHHDIYEGATAAAVLRNDKLRRLLKELT